MASFAELERSFLRKRQAEGIALAKARGKYGHTPQFSADDAEQAQTMLELGLPEAEVAARLGASRRTLYAVFRKQESVVEGLLES